jgi:FMN phosphatase YigB (HAD superfamily)
MERTTTPPARLAEAPAPPAGRADSRLAPAFARLAGDDGIRVLSLDVFDTLLFRKLPEPVDAFPVVAERLRRRGALADGVSDELFAKLRRAAEERARALTLAGGRGLEVTLEEIHRALPGSLFAGGRAPDDLAELESEVERALLVPDLDVLELVRAAREGGRTVIAVSDTYFSERQLRLFMARGPLDPARIDRVFPSSRYGAGKASGLFSVVLDELGCRPQEVLHVGDNHFSDVVAPARLGIQTLYFERRPPRLERILAREAVQHPAPLHPVHGDHGLSALRAKVFHRSEGVEQPEGLRPFWEFGAASLGPALAGFAEWVQEQAARAGCSKVFCLMREGELLARLVNAAGGSIAQTPAAVAEPVWLSRQVCARAAIGEAGREQLEALFARRQLPTLREFLATVGLTLDDLPSLAGQADRRLDDAGFGDVVIEEIVARSQLRARLAAEAHALRRRILRYVEQLRPPGERRLMLVDLGWRATTQAMLEQLLREAGADWRTIGLYLITGDPATERVLGDVDARGFLGDCGVPEGEVAAIMRSPEIFEQVCMPDHGSQVGLTEDLRPVLADAEEPSLQSVERAAVQQGILAFQREWLRYRAALPGALAPLPDGARERLLAMVLRSVVAPTGDEAALFSGWLHDENFGSRRVDPIAAGPALRALPYLEPFGLVDIPMTELYWPFGLAALHDEHLASSLRAASAGVVPWDAFSSELETGDFEVYPDLGWGFEASNRMSLRTRRNRRGLSFVRATIRGDFVKRLRLRPVHEACVLRLDWISLRCLVHERPDPVRVELESPGDIARLRVKGARAIGPKLFMVPGGDPGFVVDVERLAGGPVWRLEFECGFSVLPVARSQVRERWARTKAALRRLGKETPVGAPLRLAKRLLGRLRSA